MKLLIVEDNLSQRQAYQRSKDSLKDLSINLKFAKSYEEALKTFQSFNPDCIFIDIKLASGDIKDTKGNDLFEFISHYKSSKIIRIITSHPGDIEPEIKELVNNTLFKIYERTEMTFVDVIKETYDIFNSPIYSLINNDDAILEKIRFIYYSQIDSLICNKDIKNGLDKSRLLRYVAANLYESFLVNGVGFDEVYDWEMFFCPPILKFVYTGDIIKKNDLNEYFIVLTPSCDLIPRADGKPKVTECLLAELNIVSLEEYVTPDKSDFTNKGKDIIKNNKNTYSHFIPEIKGQGPFNINFMKLQNIQISEIDTNYTRIATISPTFMKEIMHRFSMYSSRQGQPDLDIKHLVTKYSDESS